MAKTDERRLLVEEAAAHPGIGRTLAGELVWDGALPPDPRPRPRRPRRRARPGRRAAPLAAPRGAPRESPRTGPAHGGSDVVAGRGPPAPGRERAGVASTRNRAGGATGVDTGGATGVDARPRARRAGRRCGVFPVLTGESGRPRQDSNPQPPGPKHGVPAVAPCRRLSFSLSYRDFGGLIHRAPAAPDRPLSLKLPCKLPCSTRLRSLSTHALPPAPAWRRGHDDRFVISILFVPAVAPTPRLRDLGSLTSEL